MRHAWSKDFMAVGMFMELVRRAAVPAVCIMVSAYFLHHALLGPTGLMALDGVRAEQARLEAERAAMEAEHRRISAEIALLDPAGADPDFADELVRRHLGVVRPDEVIVPLPEAPPPR
jgi:cell division protein FtsB